MHTKSPKLKSVVKKLGRDPWRSPLFHWLSENFAALEPATGGPRSDWEALRSKAILHGITDDAGNQPSVRTVRDTFRKVRDEMARRGAESAGKAKPSPHPSRLPATWCPQEATPPPATRLMVAQPSSDGSGIISSEKPTPEKALADLRRILAERSGR